LQRCFNEQGDKINKKLIEMEKVEIKFKSLPMGYKKKVAERLGIHPNTVYNVLQRGERDPKYWRVMKVFKELYN
jgi:transposase